MPLPRTTTGSARTRAALGLCAAAITLASAGCTRLHSFRHGARPEFGTEPAVGSRVTTPASGDLYAQRLNGAKGTGLASVPPDANRVKDAARAVAGAERTGRPDDAARPGNSPVEIALQAPVTLPAFSPVHSGPAVEETASRPATKVAAVTESPAAGEVTPAPASEPRETAPAGPTLESLLAQSRRKLEGLTTYQVPMNFQERVGGSLSAPEDVVLSIRRSPKAARIEWRDGKNKGREVIYAADANGGQMHVRMPEGSLIPRVAMAPDSPMATRNSRHPITEAGFDTILFNMEDGLKKQTARVPGADQIRFAGRETPAGLRKSCYKIERLAHDGETWFVYLDPDSYLPAVVQATAKNGDLMERYVFGTPTTNPPDLAAAEAFNPDARWGVPKGLFSRLARGSSGSSDDPSKLR